MTKVSVIVPAAGVGLRFGAADNKIFQQLRNRYVFMRTLDAFVSREDVCQTILVAAENDLHAIHQRFGKELSSMGVEIVRGGAVRAQSVRNALSGVSEEAELLAVHDAVRPCIAQPWIDAVFDQAARSGAAILAYPVRGTLKAAGKGNVIAATVSREQLWQAQTPQVFRSEILQRAYEAEFEGVTDDAQLVEALGLPVTLVMGDPRNVKVTTPDDLALAECVFDSLPAE